MSVSLDLQFRGMESVQRVLADLSSQQQKEAYAKALNDVGFAVRKEMQKAMDSRFDRVTPWIRKSPKVFMATPEILTVQIAPTLDTSTNYRPGKKLGGAVGVDPQQVLQAQEFGGSRDDKRSEALLRRQGWLLAGMQTVIPREPFPGSTDAYGNIKGSFIRTVLSYLQAFEEGQGYQQNMKKKARENLERGGTKKKLAQQMGPVIQKKYFIAGGRGAVSNRIGKKQTRHLPPGIWAGVGVGASRQLKPVLLFVKDGDYKPRLSLDKIAAAVDTSELMSRKLRYRIRQAAGQ